LISKEQAVQNSTTVPTYYPNYYDYPPATVIQIPFDSYSLQRIEKLENQVKQLELVAHEHKGLLEMLQEDNRRISELERLVKGNK
jgi:hypothetical protein